MFHQALEGAAKASDGFTTAEVLKRRWDLALDDVLVVEGLQWQCWVDGGAG